MIPDKRQHLRLIPIRNIYAMLGNGPTVVGKITDISMGGLAFEYAGNADESTTSHKIMHVFLKDDDEFFVTGISCSVVYDTPGDAELSTPLFNHYKRCGVKFEALSDFHREKFICFLNNDTCGLA